MTEVTIRLTPNNRMSKVRIRFAIFGHADYAQGGENDVVCAAVSILAQSMMRWVQEHQNMFTRTITFQVEEGRVELDAEVKAETFPAAVSGLSMIETGFQLLEEKYPGHVRLQRAKYGK